VYTPFETINPYDVHFVTKMCDRTLAPAFFSRRDLPQHRADASVASARAWPMPERAGATSERRAASTSAAMPPRCIVSDRGGRVQAPCGRAPARTVDVVVSIAPIDRYRHPSIDARVRPLAIETAVSVKLVQCVRSTSRPNSASRIVSEVRLSPWERRSCFTPLPSARCSGCVGQERRDG